MQGDYLREYPLIIADGYLVVFLHPKVDTTCFIPCSSSGRPLSQRWEGFSVSKQACIISCDYVSFYALVSLLSGAASQNTNFPLGFITNHSPFVF